MAKRRAKRTAKIAVPSPSENRVDADPVGFNAEKEKEAFRDPEVERWSAAIRASRDIEIDKLRTGLRLLKSHFNEEQLQTPVLKFFEENLPNLSIVKNGKDGLYEVQRNGNDYKNSFMNQVDGGMTDASLLHQISSFTGHKILSQAVVTNALGADNLQIGDSMLGDPSESQMLWLQDTLQTPGVNSQRLSIGMTPNTVRLPKHGEMLLSVHGSPLGVYKQDNMEAINESEEG